MIDWRSICSRIRDQGNCGSCSAFGSIGAWEANIKIVFGLDIDLSERDLFFCSGGFCELGNTVEKTLDKASQGIATEECCPYVDIDSLCGSGRCDSWWLTGQKLASWKSITNIEEMKKALESGPLVGVMDVHESFMHYIDGVYHNLGDIDPIVGGHCISIVGFDDSKGAWLLRNSWGTGWGMQGYCWIQYGDSGIDQEMYQIVPSADKPNPDPKPSPCKVGKAFAKISNLVPWLLHRKGRFFYMNPTSNSISPSARLMNLIKEEMPLILVGIGLMITVFSMWQFDIMMVGRVWGSASSNVSFYTSLVTGTNVFGKIYPTLATFPFTINQEFFPEGTFFGTTGFWYDTLIIMNITSWFITVLGVYNLRKKIQVLKNKLLRGD